MSPVSSELPPRVLLSSTADINRLVLRLLAGRRLPRVEFRLDGLHVLHSQRAQDRFTRLSDACNCLLGELLGGLVALGGAYLVWVRSGGLLALCAVAGAALGVWLAGKFIELAWNRLQLLRVLFDLRRRLRTGEHSAERDYPVLQATPPPVAPSAAGTLRARVPRSMRSAPAPRERVLVRNAADADHLLVRLATRWRLPRIDIDSGKLGPLDLQRAQARVAHLSRGCSYMPAAFLAAAVLLGGLLYVIWSESQAPYRSVRDDWWLQGLDWMDTVPVILSALFAALIGVALEWAWNRVRLLGLLRGLRRQFG